MPRPLLTRFATSVIALCASLAPAAAQKTLRVVMHSDLKIVDPIWTTAYITRNHGYMVYDTLFALDAKGEIKPQMLDKHEVSSDGLTYTFTLRDGLTWHDGQPVTAEDCTLSLKRWAARDALGQAVWGFVASAEPVDAKTFKIILKEPTGLLIPALGKPSSAVPFMMPKRVALTDPQKQIEDFTGSGPFIFKKEEWKPGDKAVYVKNTAYKPRPEPASALSGGKAVLVDRVEWRAIADHQQAVNALLAGEIDMIENPPHDLLPLLRKDKGVTIVDASALGFQYAFRPNHTQKPFNDPRIRQALWLALSQQPFLEAAIGDAAFYKTCKSVYICSTPLATDAGMEGLLDGNATKAQALLKEAGYDGTPVTILHPTDIAVLANLPPVAKSQLEKAGFKVDLQASDWQTLVSKVQKKEGWSAYITAWNGADILNPVMNAFLNSSCEKARSGWPCDPEMEKLREAFLRTAATDQQKTVGTSVQKRLLEMTQYVPLGEWRAPYAMRSNVSGFAVSPVITFWNVAVQ